MKLFHKIAITTLGLAMAAATGAGIARYNRSDVQRANAAEQAAQTLTFPDDNSAVNGASSTGYTTTWTASSGSFNWSISNFHI